MRIRVPNLAIGLGLVVLSGCAADVPEVDTPADIQAINEVREREFAAFSSGAVDELVALFSSDAVVMPPEAPAASGEAGVRAWAPAGAPAVPRRSTQLLSRVVLKRNRMQL